MITTSISLVSQRKVALAVADCATVTAALLGASLLRFGWDGGVQYVAERAFPAALVPVLFAIAFYVSGLYDTRRLAAPRRALLPAAYAISVASLLTGGYGWATASLPIGRGVVLEFALAVFAGIVALRFAYTKTRGVMRSRCLVVGTERDAGKVKALIEHYPDAGLNVVGLVLHDEDPLRSADAPPARAVGRSYPLLGAIDSLAELVSVLRIETLVLPACLHGCPDLLRRLRPLRYRGLRLVDVVSLHEELAREIPLDQIDDEWLFRAAMTSSRLHIRRLKRVLDVVAASVLLVPGAVVLAFAALAIKLTSRGAVLFRQERVGLGSKPFMVLKLRTMDEDAEKATGPVWSGDDDPRITPVGKVLRKFRIDELPQIFNVLRGDMSLVGPRPERPVFVQKLSEAVPFYSERLLVRPGITGWAQVMAPYAATVGDSLRKLQFDLYYAKHLSLSLDLLVLLMTAKTVLFGRERAQGGMTAGAQLATMAERDLVQAMSSRTASVGADEIVRSADRPDRTEIAQA